MSVDPSWLQICEHFSKKLEIEGEKLTGKDTSREDDMYAKGRISAYKELLGFKKSLDTRVALANRT